MVGVGFVLETVISDVRDGNFGRERLFVGEMDVDTLRVREPKAETVPSVGDEVRDDVSCDEIDILLTDVDGDADGVIVGLDIVDENDMVMDKDVKWSE